MVNEETGRILTLRALIDLCSEGTVISEHAEQALCLKRQFMQTNVTGVGESTTASNEIVNFTLKSPINPNYSAFVDIAFVMEVVTSKLLSQNVIPQDWPHIRGLTLADPEYFKTRRVDLLLGSELAAVIMLPDTRIGTPEQPIAQSTYLVHLPLKLLFDSIQTLGRSKQLSLNRFH